MQMSLHGGHKGSPPPPISDCNQEEDNYSEWDLEGEDHSYLPPEVFALTWHADVGNIMHMVPCIAYFIHQICHLLSLDMLLCECHLFSFFIVYVNHAMPSCLAKHHICEFCNAILVIQLSYMWIILWHHFLLRIKFVNNFSTFNYSSCASVIRHGHGKIWSGNKVFRANNAIWRSACCWGTLHKIKNFLHSPRSIYEFI